MFFSGFFVTFATFDDLPHTVHVTYQTLASRASARSISGLDVCASDAIAFFPILSQRRPNLAASSSSRLASNVAYSVVAFRFSSFSAFCKPLGAADPSPDPNPAAAVAVADFALDMASVVLWQDAAAEGETLLLSLGPVETRLVAWPSTPLSAFLLLLIGWSVGVMQSSAGTSTNTSMATHECGAALNMHLMISSPPSSFISMSSSIRPMASRERGRPLPRLFDSSPSMNMSPSYVRELATL